MLQFLHTEIPLGYLEKLWKKLLEKPPQNGLFPTTKFLNIRFNFTKFK